MRPKSMRLDSMLSRASQPTSARVPRLGVAALANRVATTRLATLAATLVTIPALAICVQTFGELALERNDVEQESLRRGLAQPWTLGEHATVAVPLDGRGLSSVEWSSERPMGLETRHVVANGVTLHVGAEALAEPAIFDQVASDEVAPQWQAGTALRVRLDDRWSAGVGAGWRSSSADAALSSVFERSRDIGWRDSGEGVVWFGLRAEF